MNHANSVLLERLFQDFKNEALRDIIRQLANADLDEEKRMALFSVLISYQSILYDCAASI